MTETLVKISPVILNRQCPCGVEFQTYDIDNLWCTPRCKQKYKPKQHHCKGVKGGWSY
jgi:hypothetical protein